jgi:CIC family chloride channel protein
LLGKLNYNNRYFKLIIALILGLLVGMIALLYNNFLNFITSLLLKIDLNSSAGLRTGFIFLPALGGLLVGIVIKYGSLSAKGHGIPAILASIESKERHLSYRDLLTEGFASAITIATGGSAGRIGPIIEIGSGLGDLIGYQLDLKLFDYQTMLGCGAAAGIAGLFHAPLAGIMFVTEVLFKQLEKDRLIMVTISAVAADMIIRLSGRDLFLANLNLNQPGNAVNFLLAIIIGIVAAGLGIIFIYSLKFMEKKINDYQKINSILKPALGGLIVGLIAFKLPQVLGSGNRIILDLFNSKSYNLYFLFVILFFKLVATVFTLASGGSGGIFSPALLMGSLTGLLVNQIFIIIFPTAANSAILAALIGMAAVLSAVIRAPLTASFVILEFTHNYSLIIPLLIASLIAEQVANSSGIKSVYSPTYFKRI